SWRAPTCERCWRGCCLDRSTVFPHRHARACPGHPRVSPSTVIPGRCEASNPESRDSGFALCAPRNDALPNESLLMDTLNPEHPPIKLTAEPSPRVWKFWGTSLWGVFVFAAMFVGQIGTIVYLVAHRGGPIDMASLESVGRDPQALALSVIAGLPTTLA